METFCATATRFGNYWVQKADTGELIMEIGSTTDSEIRSMWVAALFNRYDGFQNWKRTNELDNVELTRITTLMARQLYGDESWEVSTIQQYKDGPWCVYVETGEEPGCNRFDWKMLGCSSERNALLVVKAALEIALIAMDPLPKSAYGLDLLRS